LETWTIQELTIAFNSPDALQGELIMAGEGAISVGKNSNTMAKV
jgi:hypothetical protein